ncbi:MAG: pyrroline-5-carboxylate reductase [Saprospiraceae bacterium]|nr:pyrroline-5-carboxylate reductase [Bacteroidia bacterium]NNE13517.1 pyrroline-5-carboxylate reductase [Saprospiraceae bacterium]NNL91975.1 pyrroline-5-carboxylate reductase [Saprospiraceae bacterium]
MKILLIGAGNMGLSYARSFIENHVTDTNNLIILEKEKGDRIAHLKSLNIGTIETNVECVKNADLIILAVKPQDANALFANIKSYVSHDQVILSIMAGITIQSIKDNLSIDKVVRAMPNIASKIGSGMTAFYASEEVTRIEISMIQNLLAATGKTLNLEKEETLNATTAISGSGPAYVYFFMDSIIKVAEKLGLSKSEANLLVKQTFLGAIELFQQNSISCQEWIDVISSKGGTTEAAIEKFIQESLSEKIFLGIEAAKLRADELGMKIN